MKAKKSGATGSETSPAKQLSLPSYEKTTVDVKHHLTDEEKVVQSTKLVDNLDALDDLRKEAANSAAKFKTRITDLEKEILANRDKISKGYEYRVREAYIRKNHDEKLVEFLDPTTMEPFLTRPFTSDDFQMSISDMENDLADENLDGKAEAEDREYKGETANDEQQD